MFLEALPIVGDVIKGAKDIISKLVVDKDKQIAAEAALDTLKMTAESKVAEMAHDEMMGQIDINKVEAGSEDSYVRRARPTIMWICAFGLGYTYLLHPIGLWALALWAPQITPPPDLDMNQLMILLGGLLGFGGMRTAEYIKGVIKK